MTNDNDSRDQLVALTADIVSAHVSNNAVGVSEIGGLIAGVHGALSGLGAAAAIPEATKLEPAVDPRRSIKPDFLICLEDGRKLKCLKRHIGRLGFTPDQYRKRWGLAASYPMVAPNYAETRRALALKIGLGRKRAA